MGRRYAQDGEAQARAMLIDLAANPGDGEASRDQAHAPFRRRRAAARDGRAADAGLSQERRRPAHGLSRDRRFARSVGAAAAQVQESVGMVGLGAARARSAGSRAANGGAAAEPARPADVEARFARRLRRHRRELGRARGADAPGRGRRSASRPTPASTTDPRALADKILPGALGEPTRTAIARAESPAEGLALLLVSPEFVRR